MTRKLTRQLDAAYARARARATFWGAEAARAIRVRGRSPAACGAVTWLLFRQEAFNEAARRLTAARFPRPAEAAL